MNERLAAWCALGLAVLSLLLVIMFGIENRDARYAIDTRQSAEVATLRADLNAALKTIDEQHEEINLLKVTLFSLYRVQLASGMNPPPFQPEVPHE